MNPSSSAQAHLGHRSWSAFASSAMLSLVIAFILAVAPMGCSRSGGASLPEDPLILVEVAPLVGLISPMVDQGVEVRSIVPAGVSPHGYQLAPSDISDLSRAALVVRIGATLEPSIERAIEQAASDDRVFSIAQRLGIEVEACDDPSHGHDHGGHAHEVDPHLWLDPVIMKQFVAAIEPVLVGRRLAGTQHEGYRKSLEAALEVMNGSYARELAPFAGRSIVTHHDAFSRVSARYGLGPAHVVMPISSVEPTPGDLSRVVDAIRATGAGAIFIEPQFSDALPRRIAKDMGLQVRTLDPVGSADWINLMRFNLRELVAGLSAQPGEAAPTEGDG